jgi:opacity protein-like surface antigen
MPKVCITLVSLLTLALAAGAQAQVLPRDASLRYSEQLSNGSAGNCGCFTLQGAAADANWSLGHITNALHLGLAADAGIEHTGNANGAGYGLTLLTLAAGPRFTIPVSKTQTFAQALVGLAHGSGSQFPQSGNLLTASANSVAFDLGAGVDYSLKKRLSLRILQLDYLRTALPNDVNNWQNNLRVSAGVTLHFSH